MKKVAIIVVLALVLCLTLSLAACAKPQGRYMIEKIVTKRGDKTETVVIADLTDEEKAKENDYTLEIELTQNEFIIYVEGEEESRVKYHMDGKKIIREYDDELTEFLPTTLKGKRLIIVDSYTIPGWTSQDEDELIEITYYFIKK